MVVDIVTVFNNPAYVIGDYRQQHVPTTVGNNILA